mgnify:CR=1 FL=1
MLLDANIHPDTMFVEQTSVTYSSCSTGENASACGSRRFLSGYQCAAVAQSSAPFSSCSTGETTKATAPAVMEWAQNIQTLELSPEALAKVHELLEAPPRPCARLHAAARRQRDERARLSVHHNQDRRG